MIFRSKYPDVAVTDRPLHEWVLGEASGRGTRPALVDVSSGRTVTYAELAALVRGLAAGLAAEGIGKGDVVALHSPNTVLFPVVLYAVTAAGGTVTTLSPLATPAEIAKQLIDAEARLMVSVSPLVETARTAVELVRRQTGRDMEILVCDKADGYRSVLGLLNDGVVPAFSTDPAVDVAVLPYSSGTTGVPKGVMLTHRNLCTNLEQLNGLHRVDENDRVIAILPFFHIFGLTALVNNALRRGATVYVHARFDLDAFLTSLERDRITHAYVAPPVMLALAKHPAVGKLDLSHLRRVICAAAPLDAGVQAAVADRLGVEVGQAYGMTELSPASHIHADGNQDEPVACVGHLLPSTQARLVDPDTGQDAAEGEPGEVWIRGPQVMKGYFGRPEDTDATVDADGWLHTGDIGRVDEDGNWFIVDRVKELIKYKGYQVAPAELEAILVQHPGIADAAVIGVDDEEGNEIPKAFVVPMTGVPISAAEVMAHVEGQVAPYKRIRRVEFIEAVPKAASGKILRRRLREREPAGS
ncbi:4-coumarate--CoA ligase family protein [Streptomyces phaeolivaceus]|uniref:4-coumarate--CoA ligase family protein n=1 Tax=Streptomyces phaeolivaceus TaxID=2653200 RepID=A0A5P8K706_9ACTN|nr:MULTISPECIES: AMP-binding protein [Streptomyces]MDX3064875.1 AMP-binding protein [Streptomyces sp. ND04-05B]QFQ99005.1 4-coumarate--CoA ligase family protein [Streptomyces phaeolivaceus]